MDNLTTQPLLLNVYDGPDTQRKITFNYNYANSLLKVECPKVRSIKY